MIRALSSSACGVDRLDLVEVGGHPLPHEVRLEVGRGDQDGRAALDLADLLGDAIRVRVPAHAIELAALGDDREAVRVVAGIAAERRGRLEDRRRVVGQHHPDARGVEDQPPRRARPVHGHDPGLDLAPDRLDQGPRIVAPRALLEDLDRRRPDRGGTRRDRQVGQGPRRSRVVDLTPAARGGAIDRPRTRRSGRP